MSQTLDRHNRRVVAVDLAILFRVLAAVGAATLIMFSLIALVRTHWSSHWVDAPAVQVADVIFTPIVAIAFGVAGVLALLAAADHERTPKIVVGCVLVCTGVVSFIARSRSDQFTIKTGGKGHPVFLEDAHGWLLIAVGGVLVVAALAMSWRGEHKGADADILQPL